MSNPNVGSPVGGFPDGTGSTSNDGFTSEELKQQALLPQQVIDDGQQVTERSLNDLIALDKYLKAKKNDETTNASPFAGIRFGIICPPGARGSQ